MGVKKKTTDISQFAIVLLGLILVNIIGAFQFFRLDLTTEKRYSLSEVTQNLIAEIDDRVLFKVYLEGDFPAGFQRLNRETRQMLDEFRAYNKNIEYEFINPNESADRKERTQTYQQLRTKGLNAIQIEAEGTEGVTVQQIFPGALVSYKGQEVGIRLLQDQFASTNDAQINASVQNLEYTLANALRRLSITRSPAIGFVSGHGELGDRNIADIVQALDQYFNVSRFNMKEFVADSLTGDVSISHQLQRMMSYDALVIAKPQKSFTELDKYLLDQYIMRGGKTLWFIDAVHAEMDSLSYAPQFLAYPKIEELGIDKMLFKYGVRINTSLVQDLIAGGVNDRKDIHKWVYFPLIMPTVKHPVTKDLNAIRLEFAGSIDTIRTPGIKKTFLLRTSPYSKESPAPHMVSLRTLYEEPDERTFNKPHIPVGVLLEGEFTSAFKNRVMPRSSTGEQLVVKEKSSKTQMLVVADGDLIKNQINLINPNMERGAPLPLGYDQFTGVQFGNKDFMLNIVDFLLDDSNLIAIRSRELKMRVLDYQKLTANKLYWQLLNTVAPVVLIILFGIAFTYARNKKYKKKIA